MVTFQNQNSQFFTGKCNSAFASSASLTPVSRTEPPPPLLTNNQFYGKFVQLKTIILKLLVRIHLFIVLKYFYIRNVQILYANQLIQRKKYTKFNMWMEFENSPKRLLRTIDIHDVFKMCFKVTTDSNVLCLQYRIPVKSYL